jgi:hypothetical protein
MCDSTQIFTGTIYIYIDMTSHKMYNQIYVWHHKIYINHNPKYMWCYTNTYRYKQKCVSSTQNISTVIKNICNVTLIHTYRQMKKICVIYTKCISTIIQNTCDATQILTETNKKCVSSTQNKSTIIKNMCNVTFMLTDTLKKYV